MNLLDSSTSTPGVLGLPSLSNGPVCRRSTVSSLKSSSLPSTVSNSPEPENGSLSDDVPELPSRKWMTGASQNLASLLNDPHRGKQRDFFTKTWGDSFVSTKPVTSTSVLAPVAREDFSSYLRRTSRRHRKHLLRKSIPSVSDSTSTSGSTSSRAGGVSTPDLSSVPRVFLSPSFDLCSPQTFQEVFPSLLSLQTSSKASSPGRLQQEELSHYLDTIEISIAAQVATKSTAFCEAVLSQDVIMERLSEASIRVSLLRSVLNSFDEGFTPDMVAIHVKKRKLMNLQDTLKVLRIMSTIRQTQPTIQVLLAGGDFLSALELIETSQDILRSHLDRIHCFRHLNSQLDEMDRAIAIMLENDFVTYAASHLNRPVSEPAGCRDGDRVTAVILGLLKQKNLLFLQRLREESLTALKALVKQCVAEALARLAREDDGDTPSGFETAESVGALQVRDWVDFLQDTFQHIIAFVRRLKALCEHICAAQALSTSHEETDEESDDAVDTPDGVGILEPSVSRSLDTLLRVVSEEAHERTARLLSSKHDVDKLSPSDFITLNRLCGNFSLSLEELCGKKSPILSSALQGVAIKFVSSFHAAHRSKLEMLLRGERWQAADVPEELQRLVNDMGQGQFRLSARSSSSGSFEESKAAPSLLVDGEEYLVVGVVLLLIRMLSEYCEFSAENKSLSGDLLSRLVDLLVLFNSQMSQLLLGAGAMEAAGLRNITVRNLGLGWRALQLLKGILPKIRAHFAGALEERSVPIRKLDAVVKDFETHGSQVNGLILTILETAVRTSMDKWELRAPVPSPPVKAVCKQLTKLKEALQGVLPPVQIEQIFRKIHETFVQRVKFHILRLGLRNDGGPQVGLLTSELTFYREQVKALGCFPSNSRMVSNLMMDVWAPE